MSCNPHSCTHRSVFYVPGDELHHLIFISQIKVHPIKCDAVKSPKAFSLESNNHWALSEDLWKARCRPQQFPIIPP